MYVGYVCQSGAEEDVSMMLDTTGSAPAQSNLLMSSIDGNVEQTDAPDTNSTSTAPKIRFSGALGGLLAKAEANKAAAAAAAAALSEVSAITVIGVNNSPIVFDLDEDSTHAAADKTTEQHKNVDNNNETTEMNDKNKENGMLDDEG